jgi:hypothetical protein
MKIQIAIAVALSIGCTAVHAADLPFVGKWDCGISDFEFTNRTYNNGSETIPILKVEKAAKSYRLTFAKGYAISLLNVKARSMVWHSLATADTFECKRKIAGAVDDIGECQSIASAFPYPEEANDPCGVAPMAKMTDPQILKCVAKFNEWKKTIETMKQVCTPQR